MSEITVDQLALLGQSLSAIGLRERTVNRLENHGIDTVEDLLSRTKEELLEIPHIGEETLNEVFRCLSLHGFQRTV